MTDNLRLALAAAALVLGAGPTLAHQPPAGSPAAAVADPWTRAPAAEVDAFRAALEAGTIPAALANLNEDAVAAARPGA